MSPIWSLESAVHRTWPNSVRSPDPIMSSYHYFLRRTSRTLSAVVQLPTSTTCIPRVVPTAALARRSSKGLAAFPRVAASLGPPRTAACSRKLKSAYAVVAMTFDLPPFFSPVSSRSHDTVPQSLPVSYSSGCCAAGSDCNPSANAPQRISSHRYARTTRHREARHAFGCGMTRHIRFPTDCPALSTSVYNGAHMDFSVSTCASLNRIASQSQKCSAKHAKCSQSHTTCRRPRHPPLPSGSPLSWRTSPSVADSAAFLSQDSPRWGSISAHAWKTRDFSRSARRLRSGCPR